MVAWIPIEMTEKQNKTLNYTLSYKCQIFDFWTIKPSLNICKCTKHVLQFNNSMGNTNNVINKHILKHQ